jgi:hypothetical protein
MADPIHQFQIVPLLPLGQIGERHLEQISLGLNRGGFPSVCQ